MEYVQLLGAEEVRAAASRMQSAADDIRSAAASLDHTVGFTMRNMLEDHQRWMDGWLERFEKIVTGSDMPAPAPEPVAEPPIEEGPIDDDIPL